MEIKVISKCFESVKICTHYSAPKKGCPLRLLTGYGKAKPFSIGSLRLALFGIILMIVRPHYYALCSVDFIRTFYPIPIMEAFNNLEEKILWKFFISKL